MEEIKKSLKESEDWLGINEETPVQNSFFNKTFEGEKGRLLLELQKTYKGDERFKLNDKFANIEVSKLPRSLKSNVTYHKHKKESQTEEQKIMSKVITEVIGEKNRPKKQIVNIGIYDPTLAMGENLIVASQEKKKDNVNNEKVSKGKPMIKRKKVEKAPIKDNGPKVLQINSTGWKDIIKSAPAAFSIANAVCNTNVQNISETKEEKEEHKELPNKENKIAKEAQQQIKDKKKKKKKNKKQKEEGKEEEEKKTAEPTTEEIKLDEEEIKQIERKRNKKKRKLAKMKKLMKIDEEQLPEYYATQFNVDQQKAEKYIKYTKMIEDARTKQKKREKAQ